MNRRIFFLKDSEINDWLVEGFSKRKINVSFMGLEKSSQMLQKSRITRILSLHVKYLKLAIRSIIKSKYEDIIICFLDNIGLYVFFLSKVLFIRRRIIVINIMFNNYPDVITKIKKYLYRLMLKDSYIYPTVTSSDLPAIYRNIFNLPDKEFYLLHDCYGKLSKYKQPFCEGNNYVFCGGTNGRDYKSLLKIAGLLPHIRFVIVGPKKNTLGEEYPSNIEYHYNIEFHLFQDLIHNCSILALPLKTQAPAGLIVLFTAGLMSKPVITSDTPTMREYIIQGEHGILVETGDTINFASEIGLLLDDTKKQRRMGENLFKKIDTSCSPDAFIEKMLEIINHIEHHENTSNK
jgi:glycosyltransferase involved in cell wall biosynthesis